MFIYFVLRLVLYSNSLLCQYMFTALSRTVPETQKWKRVLSLNNECTKYIITNFKVHLIFEPLLH